MCADNSCNACNGKIRLRSGTVTVVNGERSVTVGNGGQRSVTVANGQSR